MNGFRVIFEKGKGLITKDNLVIAIAHRNNSELYELNLRKPIWANLSTKDEETVLWHKRMGHINYNNLRKLQEQTTGINVNLSKLPADLCEVCIEGKQIQKPYNHKRRRGARPLQLVHSDLIGPSLQSHMIGRNT